MLYTLIKNNNNNLIRYIKTKKYFIISLRASKTSISMIFKLLEFINSRQMLQKLKNRWEIESNFQLILILLTFSITGSLSVMVRQPIFEYLNIDASTSLWVKIPLSLLIITPSYQILLIIVGSILGQFNFFWAFEKKMLSRFRFGKQKQA